MRHNQTEASDFLHKIDFKKVGPSGRYCPETLFDVTPNAYAFGECCNFSLLTRCCQGKDASHITPQVNNVCFWQIHYRWLWRAGKWFCWRRLHVTTENRSAALAHFSTFTIHWSANGGSMGKRNGAIMGHRYVSSLPVPHASLASLSLFTSSHVAKSNFPQASSHSLQQRQDNLENTKHLHLHCPFYLLCIAINNYAMSTTLLLRIWIIWSGYQMARSGALSALSFAC